MKSSIRFALLALFALGCLTGAGAARAVSVFAVETTTADNKVNFIVYAGSGVGSVLTLEFRLYLPDVFLTPPDRLLSVSTNVPGWATMPDPIFGIPISTYPNEDDIPPLFGDPTKRIARVNGITSTLQVDPVRLPSGSEVFNFWLQFSPAVAANTSYNFEYRYALDGSEVFEGGTGSFASPIPEPSTYVLMLAGLLGLGFIARRRRA